MALLKIHEMFLGEIAEVVTLNGALPEMRQLRDMGLREGRLVDLLHYDPLISQKVMIGLDGARVAFHADLAQHICVRPLKSHYQALKNMANFDNLTSCLNRHAADNILRQEVERFTDANLPLSLLMADLDHFKKVNDTFGHDAGDAVLKKFADVTRTVLRRSDLFCRWGGEEFLILLRGTIGDESLQIANRLRRRVESLIFPPFEVSGLVTVSIGSAALPPGRPFERLLADADAALYRAKHEGRNRVVLC